MYDLFGLFIWSFAEAVFFPIPPDALLMGLILYSPNLAYLFAFVATLGSLSGAIIGYLLGLLGGRPLVNKWIKSSRLNRVETLFKQYDYWTIIIAAFTPLPYKVFAIGAGVFQISFTRFLAASIVGRSIRFFAETFLVVNFGRQIISWMDEYFNIMSFISVGVILGIVLLVNCWKKKKE